MPTRSIILAWLSSLLFSGAVLLSGLAEAASPSPAARDRWTDAELAVLASMRLSQLPAAPADPSNAVARSPAAIELGRRLFADVRFSANGAVSCATCHDPRKQFQDGLPVGRGVGFGSRRAMPIVGAPHSAWLFWDGRKDSLWSQALGPLEDAAEHGGNRMRYAHLIAAHYRADYEALFGPMPNLAGQPMDAGPQGSDVQKAAWAALDAGQREGVSRVFANMGKAIAAFEASLRHESTRLDRYLEGIVKGDAAAPAALQADEARGLRLFIGKAQCASCHNGPLFTDQHFHNTGVPPRDAARPDRGRAAAIAAVQADEFNCLGRFSDAAPAQCQELRFMVTNDPSMEGAFKTPGLRGVALRPPYMHAGQFASLEEVVRHYVAAPHAAVGRSELARRSDSGRQAGLVERAPIDLSDDEMRDLVRFLGTL